MGRRRRQDRRFRKPEGSLRRFKSALTRIAKTRQFAVSGRPGLRHHFNSDWRFAADGAVDTMPCNGSNHSYSCNCGWGGVFHGLGLAEGGRYWQRAESYTVPNARCRECRAHVFFYQSPFGGKVYFDSLGPPWPKHSCSQVHRYGGAAPSWPAPGGRPRQGIGPASQPPRIRVAEGWWPILCSAIRTDTHHPEIVVFDMFEGEGRKQVFAKFDVASLDVRNPFLIHNTSAPGQRRRYEISTLSGGSGTPSELRIRAFTVLEDLLSTLKREALDATEKQREAAFATAVGLPRLAAPIQTTQKKSTEVTGNHQGRNNQVPTGCCC